MKITHSSGRILNIEAFNLDNTYAALIEGQPNADLNHEIYDMLHYPRNWGKRNTIKIKPSHHDFQHVLPPVFFSVWLTSEPFNARFCGSQLVVMWLGDLDETHSIKQIIMQGISEIDWDNNAKDYDL